MSKQFLRGLVAAILDDQRLIINLGMEQGVSCGDQFIVYEEGDQINDPQSGESLGGLELVKTILEAVHVQEKMALVMPIRKETTTQSTVLSATLAQTHTTTPSSSNDIYRDRLNVQKNQTKGLKQVNGTISIGDKIRSVEAV
jgi:hypothetical protein